MEIIKTLVWIVQIIAAISVIILVLMQHGKGADAGATFGAGGGSGSLFGASGSGNFLSRATAITAAVFFIATLSLVIMATKANNVGVMAQLKATASAPVVESNSIPK